jgi:hypothetical protein
LFASEEAALTLTKSFGKGWESPTDKQSGHKFDELDATLYSFHVGEETGRVALAVDAKGQLKLYEVRFPSVDGVCIGTPDHEKLARILLDNTEPAAANDVANVRMLASLPDLVWPYTGTASGPGAQFGETTFSFYKMNDYCSFRVIRLREND